MTKNRTICRMVQGKRLYGKRWKMCTKNKELARKLKTSLPLNAIQYKNAISGCPITMKFLFSATFLCAQEKRNALEKKLEQKASNKA